jgi:hypothetical protein
MTVSLDLNRARLWAHHENWTAATGITLPVGTALPGGIRPIARAHCGLVSDSVALVTIEHLVPEQDCIMYP